MELNHPQAHSVYVVISQSDYKVMFLKRLRANNRPSVHNTLSFPNLIKYFKLPPFLLESDKILQKFTANDNKQTKNLRLLLFLNAIPRSPIES